MSFKTLQRLQKLVRKLLVRDKEGTGIPGITWEGRMGRAYSRSFTMGSRAISAAIMVIMMKEIGVQQR